MEVTGSGTGKFGELYASITSMDGQTVFRKANGVSRPSGNGGLSRAATVQVVQSDKFMWLKKAILMHEFITDMTDNWVGKIWQWK
jgi:hypothetical protein